MWELMFTLLLGQKCFQNWGALHDLQEKTIVYIHIPYCLAWILVVTITMWSMYDQSQFLSGRVTWMKSILLQSLVINRQYTWVQGLKLPLAEAREMSRLLSGGDLEMDKLEPVNIRIKSSLVKRSKFSWFYECGSMIANLISPNWVIKGHGCHVQSLRIMEV